MLIDVQRTWRYSTDGFTPTVLEPGRHEVADEWATRAIRAGYAVAVEEDVAGKRSRGR